MANENDVLACPETIRNRSDAVQLWKHLLSRGIAFHWEDDPADIVDIRTGARLLTETEARNIARLYDEVAELDDEWVYDAACSLGKLAFLVGGNMLAEIPLDTCDVFDRCGSEKDALTMLSALASPERPLIQRTIDDAHVAARLRSELQPRHA